MTGYVGVEVGEIGRREVREGGDFVVESRDGEAGGAEGVVVCEGREDVGEFCVSMESEDWED